MGVFTVVEVVRATPPAIWSLLRPSLWPRWDADLKSVEDVSGDGSLVQAATCTMTLQTGLKFAGSFPDVVENERFLMEGPILMGLGKVEMSMSLRPLTSSTTEVTYSFGLTRPAGHLVYWLMRDKEGGPVKGTVEGMRRLKALAEQGHQ